MNIVHIFGSFVIGGAQTMLTDIMNVQIKTDNVSLILITDRIESTLVESLDDRIKIIRFHRVNGSLNIIPFIKLNLHLLTHKYDAIHLHLGQENRILIMPWFNLYYTVHNTGRYKKIFKKCKKIFAISKSVQEGLMERGFTNVVLAPNGLNFSIIKKKNWDDQDNHEFKMVQVSRLIINHKGQDLILKAFDYLKQEGKLPSNIRIDFIGDGEDRIKLEKLVLRYNLESHVSFLGEKTRDYVYQNLCKYNLFIQPSRYEGFGLTVAEAMAAKIPVLVSNIEGPYEIIGFGKFGTAFQTEDYKDLANKIIYVYNNYDQLRSVVNLGYNFVVKQFNVANTAKMYLNNYI